MTIRLSRYYLKGVAEDATSAIVLVYEQHIGDSRMADTKCQFHNGLRAILSYKL